MTVTPSLFNARFFPQHLLLLTAGENLMPMGYWTVISKEPFRFLICMQTGNHTLGLVREIGEVALHFMPWSDRERVVAAGHLSGRDVDKAATLGYELLPASTLRQTRLVAGFDSCYETVVHQELDGLSHEFALFVLDVTATHGTGAPARHRPILYQSGKDYATIGDTWRHQR